MPSTLYRLGHLMARVRALVVVIWLVVPAALGSTAGLVQKGTNRAFSIPGSSSQTALDHLTHVFPEVSGTSAQAVVLVPPGRDVDTPALRTAVTDAATRLKAVDQVAIVANPFDPSVPDAVSGDHRAARTARPPDGPSRKNLP